MPCADIPGDVLAAVPMVLLIGLHLIEQEHLIAFAKFPDTGMFEAWQTFWKLGAAALHAFGELFGQFPGRTAECHQHVYPLKQGRADLIEVGGDDDCTDVSEKTGRPIGTVGEHVMSFVHDQPVGPTRSTAKMLDKGQ